jgi:hypothetical protein
MCGGIRRKFERAAFVLIFLSVFTAGLLRAAEAQTVTLLWDSNREIDIAGYVLSYGTQPGEPTDAVDVGNHTSYQFSHLETGQRYYFSVRAYNTSGLISDPSEEASATVGTVSMSLTNLIANLTPPQRVGTAVILAAAASGGVPPYQYKWFISDGTRWTIARDWSADNTFTWQPQVANSNYAVTAWARGANNTADAPENSTSQRTLRFAITPSARR